MKSTKFLWSCLIILILLLFGSYIIPQVYFHKSQVTRVINSPSSNEGITNNYNRSANGFNGYGMMRGNRVYRSNLYVQSGLSEDKVNEEVKNSLANVKIDNGTNSVTYSEDNIKIVLLASAKQADDKFLVDGLVNPTVYIPKNSTVTLELINEDEDVPHAFEITSAAPPYANMSMMQGGVYPGSFIDPIPYAASGKFYAASTSFTAKYDGEFYYICQYPGHASQGMYGKIIVQ